MLTWISTEVRNLEGLANKSLFRVSKGYGKSVTYTSRLAPHRESSRVKGSFESCWTYIYMSVHERYGCKTREVRLYVQLGPRSTGQEATGHPTLVVTLNQIQIGRI